MSVLRLPRVRIPELQNLLSLPAPDRRAEFKFDSEVGETVMPEEFESGIETMSLPRRRFVGCWYLSSQVSNGGFQQFFDDCGPDSAADALAFLDDRGPQAVAALLRRAIEALPGCVLPETKDELGDMTESVADKLDKISDKFFEGDYDATLVRTRLELVRDHAREFFA